MRLLPAPRLLYLLGAWTAAAAALPWLPLLQPAWLAAGGVLFLAAGTDAVRLWRQGLPACTREHAAAFPLGMWRDIVLQFDNRGRASLQMQVFDHIPAETESDAMPLACLLPPGQRTRLSYRLRCNSRGRRIFPGVGLRRGGGFGLLLRQDFLSVQSEVKVYPNFAEVAKYALLASDNRLSQMGIRLRRRRGTGMEFHQLREYRESDTPRQIDWKATSRLRKLISREYQDERDQQVVMVLDAGFRMRSRDDRLSHFDQALNALLLLAHVVLRQGDSVGLMTFASSERFLPPGKGRNMLGNVMEAVFDLEPGPDTPDFLGMCTQFGERIRKRSLVVIITSLRDEDAAEIGEACRLLGERHLVLVANLRERTLDTLDTLEPDDTDSALTVAATHLYLQERDRTLNRLRHEGVVVLDVLPDNLAIGLINRYMAIKRSGRL